MAEIGRCANVSKPDLAATVHGREYWRGARFEHILSTNPMLNQLAPSLSVLNVTITLMSVSASAKNMEAVCKAKEVHDRTCPWGGKGTEVHLAWFDIERIGWEEGDVICGLIVVGDASVATGMMRVTCDAEGDGAGLSESEEVEEVEAVAADRELVITK